MSLIRSACFFDCETGGLRAQHPTIQIAAIAVSPDWAEMETFERKIRFDEAACEPEALALNSYDRETWQREAVPEPVALQDFGAMLKRHASVEMTSKAGKQYKCARVAGHNIVGFDLERLAADFKRHGLFFPATFIGALDTRHGAVWHFEMRGGAPKSYKLTDLCDYFAIPRTGAHDALTDVRMSIALARQLMEAW